MACSVSLSFHSLPSNSLYLFCRRQFGLVSRHWERKRFYKQVVVHRLPDDQYGVCLDNRNLRTPLRKVFAVPSKSLALAVAQEWDVQTGIIQPSLMHLTGLCNTVIDNPLNNTRDDLVKQAIRYLTFDTICFRSTEPVLAELQEKEWDPILNWFNERFNGDLKSTTSLTMCLPSLELIDSIREYINGMDVWSVAGFTHALESSSSLVLTSALFGDRVNPLQACELSQLEMRHQTSRWGTVEWQHSIQTQDLLSRLSASLLLMQLSKDLTLFTSKELS